MDTPLPTKPGPDDRLPPFSTIRAEVEQALANAIPGFPTWSATERQRWQISQDPSVEELKNRVRHALVAKAIGKTPEEVAATDASILSNPEQRLDELGGPMAPAYANAVALVMDGIGEDLFFLNDTFHDGETLAHFRTVGDWDRDDHAYQQEARQRDFGSAPQPYRGSLYGEWARCVVDDQLAYLSLYHLHHYVAADLENRADDRIKTLVPHRFKANPDHGTRTAGGFVWSMGKDAQGLEDVLRALEKARDDHIQQVTQRLGEEAHANTTPQVWFFRTHWPYEPHWEHHYAAVFLNAEASDRVRWTSFVSDVATIAGDEADLAEVMEREGAAIESVLNDLYATLMVGREAPDPAALPADDPMFPDADD